MPLLDKLSKAAKNAAAGASTLAKNAADSTGEAIAVQKLKMKINDEEKAIVEIKKFLGELTWQQFDGQGDKSAEIEEQCGLIRDSLKNIAEIEQQIADLRAEKEAARSERKAAAAAGFVNVKGHRLVGGMRASIYNAVPMKAVHALVEFMKDYEVKNRV